MYDATAVSSDAGLWFRRHRTSGTVRLRLVCFPHAGGAAHAFRTWAACLPSGVEVLAVRYPGRHDRLSEPCATTLEELAGQITDALVPHLDVPVMLFGHSMGATVAYEVALGLEARHGTIPARLLVSSRTAPHRTPRRSWHEVDDDTLIQHLRAVGTVGTEAFDIPELRALILPPLRADFRLIERYRPARDMVTGAPISAYVGSRDPDCTPADAAAWAELSASGDFSVDAYDGDHFYLVPREADLLAAVARHMAPLLTAAQ